jgi:hypothetical protein
MWSARRVGVFRMLGGGGGQKYDTIKKFASGTLENSISL